MPKPTVSKTDLKSTLDAANWKLIRNQSYAHEKSIEHRHIHVRSVVDYESSKTKAQQRNYINALRKLLGGDWDDFSEVEWTNEDGGDLNTVDIWLYVRVSI